MLFCRQTEQAIGAGADLGGPGTALVAWIRLEGPVGTVGTMWSWCRSGLAALLLVLSAACVLAPDVRAETLSVMTQLETIGYDDRWGTHAVREVPQGGHVLAVLRLDGARCRDLQASGDAASFMVFVAVELASPSSAGGNAGLAYDLLVPRNGETCALSPYVLAEWHALESGTVTITGGAETVSVDVEVSPARTQQRPFLVGMTASYIMAGHCDPDCPPEVPLVKAYGDLLAAHGVQPIQSWIRFPAIVDGRLDLGSGGEGSFRDRVMAYDGGGSMVGFPRARWYEDPEAYLAALERTVREEHLVGRAWVYAADEPGDIDALARELEAYRRLAPSVLVMVTTTRDPRLDSLVDIYAPVLNRLGRASWPAAPVSTSRGWSTSLTSAGAPTAAASPTTTNGSWPPVTGVSPCSSSPVSPSTARTASTSCSGA